MTNVKMTLKYRRKHSGKPTCKPAVQASTQLDRMNNALFNSLRIRDLPQCLSESTTLFTRHHARTVISQLATTKKPFTYLRRVFHCLG